MRDDQRALLVAGELERVGRRTLRTISASLTASRGDGGAGGLEFRVGNAGL